MMYIEIVLVICLYFLVRKKYRHTVGYIHALLIFQVITITYGVAAVDAEINSSNFAVMLLTYMTLILGICLWYLPNLKYFEKRKWYFENKEKDEIEPSALEELNTKVIHVHNKRAKVIMAFLLGIGVVASIVSAVIIEIQTDNINELLDRVYILQDKADFLDENVVIVIEGDAKYYYTYEQLQQLPNDKDVYYINVYTDIEAEALGYERWQ